MFPADTTVLTIEGWKGYAILSTNDLVATFKRKTGEFKFQQPTEIIKIPDYEGVLIHIKNINTNQLLTPEHSILIKKPFFKGSYPNRKKYWDSSWSFALTRALPKVVYTKGRLNLPLAGKYKSGKLSIGDYYAELLGWIITDGSFNKRCSAIQITQSSVHPKKVDRIRFLLDQLNVKYSERTREYNPKELFKKYKDVTNFKDQINTMHRFYLNVSGFTERIRRIIPDKKPTWDLLQLKPSELISLFKGLLAGDSDLYAKSGRLKDGTRKNTCTFGQKDSHTRVWVQALSTLIGCRSIDSPDIKTIGVVAICGRDTTMIKKPHVTIKKTKSPLKVWGVETKNKSVVCRRTTIEENTKREKVRKSYVFITGGNVTKCIT